MKTSASLKSSHQKPSRKWGNIRVYLPFIGMKEKHASAYLLGCNGKTIDDPAHLNILLHLFLCQSMISCGINMEVARAIDGWVVKGNNPWPPFIQILNNEIISVADRKKGLSLKNFEETNLPRDIYISMAFDVSLMQDKINLWMEAVRAGQPLQ